MRNRMELPARVISFKGKHFCPHALVLYLGIESARRPRYKGSLTSMQNAQAEGQADQAGGNEGDVATRTVDRALR